MKPLHLKKSKSNLTLTHSQAGLVAANEVNVLHESAIGKFVMCIDPVNIVFIMMCGCVGSILAVLLYSDLLQTIFIPIPSLIDCFITRIPGLLRGDWKGNKSLNCLSFGFFACFVADLLMTLTWITTDMFYGGMAAYMIAHILFITGFSISGEPVNLKRLLPLLLFVGGMLTYLCYNCGVFSNLYFGIAIIVYAALEMCMCWRALSRIGYKEGEENKKSQWLVGIGAVLFMMSDLLLISRKMCSYFDPELVFQIFYFIFYCIGVIIMAVGCAHRYDSPSVLFHVMGHHLLHKTTRVINV